MKFATVVLAPTVLAALLGCGSSGGTSGVIETPPRTFPVCDANGDFQNARPVSDLEEKIRTYIPRVDYFIEASLTDSEYLMYFAGCASDRVPACELLRAHFSIDGEVSYVDYVNPGARSPRHPSISGDGLNLVWSETYGRGARVYAARTDEEFGDVFYDRREILPLPEGSSVRFADPYIARDNRVYVMLGPSSGVSTVHSAPLATDGPAVAYDPKLTGTSPVIDGANRVFLGR